MPPLCSDLLMSCFGPVVFRFFAAHLKHINQQQLEMIIIIIINCLHTNDAVCLRHIRIVGVQSIDNRTHLDNPHLCLYVFGSI